MAEINGDFSDNILDGTAEDDVIDGGSGDDIITGGAGNDTLTGGRGDDTYVFSAGHGSDIIDNFGGLFICLLYTSPSPRDKRQSRMPSSA